MGGRPLPPVRPVHPQEVARHQIEWVPSGYLRPVRLLAPAAAAVLLLVLTGCSEPEPGSPMPTGRAPATSAEPSATASATTASPTPTSDTPEPTQASQAAPTLPPEATTNDAAGAEAFVRYWFDTVNYAYDHLDAGPLQAASLDTCSVCGQIADEINEYARNGERVDGGAFTTAEVVSPAPDGTGVNVVSIVYSQEPYTVLNSAGEEVSQSAGEKASLGAVVRREADEWQMYDLGS